MFAGGGRRDERVERSHGRFHDTIEQSAGGRGATARQQLDDAKARDPVAQVLGPAQAGENILDVGGFEELEAAELHERDVAARQLDLERRAVMRRAEQHGLRLERDAALAVLQHLCRDIARLLALVAHVDELRPFRRGAVRPEILGEALVGEIDHAVRRRQYRLRRAVVALERGDVGRRTEMAGEIENIAHRRGTKRIDRLRVVADHGEAAAGSA